MKAIIEFACSLTAAYEPEPEPVSYLVEPIILGPDGWMAFENPSRQSLERSFEEGQHRRQLELAFAGGKDGQDIST